MRVNAAWLPLEIVPFGGVKRSGIGNVQGRMGMLAACEVKCVIAMREEQK